MANKISNAPGDTKTLVDLMEDNEEDNDKIISLLDGSHLEEEELDKYELIAIRKAIETWDALSVKCTKKLLIKLMLNTNFRLDHSLETMNVMLSRGCCKSYNDNSNPDECSTLITSGSCEKTKP
ncbi:MAG: hypothetical protein HN786_04470 [Cellvibrionales bacterium]|jgi:hypothetical protein|nr:hypothetical protein [Cellvibrionales bacterium]